MVVTRDRLRALFEVVAEGDPTKVRHEGKRLLDEVDSAMVALRRDRRMIEDLLGRYGGAEDEMTPPQRSARVRQAAIALASAGREELTAQDVLEHLEASNVRFAVKRPASMVGSVLFQMDEFERLGVNRFKYTGASSDSESPQNG